MSEYRVHDYVPSRHECSVFLKVVESYLTGSGSLRVLVEGLFIQHRQPAPTLLTAKAQDFDLFCCPCWFFTFLSILTR